jgi:hypothetical protein
MIVAVAKILLEQVLHLAFKTYDEENCCDLGCDIFR